MDCTSNHGGITGGRHKWVVHTAVISTPVLGSICPGMFLQQRTARWLVQRGIKSCKCIERRATRANGDSPHLGQHKFGAQIT